MMRSLKRIATCILFALPTAVQASELDPRIGLLDTLAAEGRLEDAVQGAHNLLRRIETPNGHDSLRILSYMRLGSFFYMMGYYDSSAYYSSWALRMLERQLPGDQELRQGALTSLANMYSETGNYRRARSYYERAIELLRSSPNWSPAGEAYLVDRLALLYRRLGNLNRAESLLTQALQLHSEDQEGNPVHLAYAMHNLANLYRAQGRNGDAEELLLQALDLQVDNLGTGHHEVASTLNDLANTYLAQRRFDEADSVQREAIRITEQRLGPRHPWVSFGLRDLARVHAARGDFQTALADYRRSYYLLENSVGAHHPQAAAVLTELAEALRVVGEDAQAVTVAHQAYRLRRDLFDATAGSLQEREALLYAHLLRESVDEYLSAALDAGYVEGTELDILAGVMLSTKGHVSDGIFARQRSWVSETDSITLERASELRSARDLLARYYVRGYGDLPEDYLDTLRAAVERVHDLERELIDRSPSYRRHRAMLDVDPRALAQKLKPGAVLVEYLKFNYRSAGDSTAQPLYVALTLQADGGAHFYRLGPASEIERRIDAYRSHMVETTTRAGLPDAEWEAHYRVIARNLFDLIWAPLHGRVRGASVVYVAADAGLSLVAFGTLVTGANRYLLESVPIQYVAAGRDLFRVDDQPETGQGLLALGAPDYNYAGVTAGEMASDAAPSFSQQETGRLVPSCEYFRDLDVPGLPLSAYEVTQIAEAWHRVSSEPSVVLLGTDATETRFKQAAAGTRVIHLATHGFYISETCGDLPQPIADHHFIADHPLLLSGLFLAGANRRLAADESAQLDEGVLTAYEISALDLRGVEVVVLSACETGLGSVEEGEGVYGLRRAFQMAGAQTVISSLWAVPDRETAVFMSKLYQPQNADIHERLRSLQLQQISELRAQGLSDHPVSWGAFIASGARSNAR